MSPPPGRYLRDESERQLRFNLLLASLLPSLAVRDVAVDDLGDGIYRVTADVANDGLTATEMQKRLERARPVTATLTADRPLEFLAGEAETRIGHLPGAPAEPAAAEWLVRVRGAGPTEFTVTARAPTAGSDTGTVTAGG